MKFIFHTSGKPTEGEAYTVPYTVITNSFLDEELDSTSIELNKIDRAEPFKPFTIVTMYASDSDVIRWMVATDNAVKDIPTGKWTHTVTLIEPTKWLERWMVGNKAVTQQINKYFDDEEPADVVPDMQLVREFGEILGYRNLNLATLLDLKDEYKYSSPMQMGGKIPIYFPFAFDSFKDDFNQNEVVYGGEFYYILQNGNIVDSGEISSLDQVGKAVDIKEYSPEMGQLKIIYIFNTYGTAWSGYFYGSYTIDIAYDAEEISTATAALSMITAAQNLLENESGIFELDADTVPDGKCPELTVTNATLREALDEIGKTFGAISRLDIEADGDAFSYKIRFEKFCKDELAELPDSPGEVIASISCEDYCTSLDATVSNLVRYSDGGTIIDPAPDAFRTLRSEDASYRVTETSGEIFTAFPIERLDHLWVNISAIDESKTKEEDIAQYCFESSEYSLLSSYLASYPYSKAYALEYTLGRKNIRGLSFEQESAVSQLFKQPAIVNIINAEFKTTFTDLSGLDFTKILFRVEYVPTGEARVRMRKPWSFGERESVLPYNQSAAKIDSVAFGRAMFGNVLRMGNEQTSYTFTVPLDYAAPERGCRIGENGYIAEVKTEYAPASKKVTFVIVQGFNRLSAFVGVNQSLRLFEISERMSLDRHIIAEDFCIIGKEPREAAVASAAKTSLKAKIKAAFTAPTESTTSVVARAQGYSQEHALSTVLLPCLTYALGNSIVFNFSYSDNFGAGRRIDPISYESEMFKTETDVTYADAFGRIDLLDVSFLEGAGVSSDKLSDLANALPALIPDQTEDSNKLAEFLREDSNAIVINKDSREAIKGVTYQLNFMEADGIKVSPSFAESTAFGAEGKQLFFVTLNKSVNNLTQNFATEDTAQNSTDGEVEDFVNGFRVTFTVKPEGAGETAWAVIDKSGRFCFGANEPLPVGDFSIYFSFVHK